MASSQSPAVLAAPSARCWSHWAWPLRSMPGVSRAVGGVHLHTSPPDSCYLCCAVTVCTAPSCCAGTSSSGSSKRSTAGGATRTTDMGLHLSRQETCLVAASPGSPTPVTYAQLGAVLFQPPDGALGPFAQLIYVSLPRPKSCLRCSLVGATRHLCTARI